MRDGNAPGHGALGRADRSYGMAIAKPDGLPACRRTGLAPRQTPHLGWWEDTKPGSVCETPALKSVPSLPQKEFSMNSKSPGGFERFIGIDLHKHYLVVGGVNAGQEVVVPPRRVNLENWLKWATANLKPTDAVVLEATTNAWEIYDQVLPLVGRAVVANPVQVKPAWRQTGG